jgi:hypothetical protein
MRKPFSETLEEVRAEISTHAGGKNGSAAIALSKKNNITVEEVWKTTRQRRAQYLPRELPSAKTSKFDRTQDASESASSKQSSSYDR